MFPVLNQENMGKRKRSKCIGFKKKKGAVFKSRHQPLQSVPKFHDHSYAIDPDTISSLPVNDNCSIVPVCNFVGDFDKCDCVVHYQDVNYIKELNTESDSINCIIVGSSIVQCDSEEDEKRFLFENLKNGVKSKVICFNNELGFEVMNTTKNVTLIKYYEERIFSVMLVVEVNKQLEVSVTVHGKKVPYSSARIFSIADLSSCLRSFNTYAVCIGNPDEEFCPTQSSWLEEDVGAHFYNRTIRASDCKLLTLSALRCGNCSKHRKVLRKKMRLKKQSCTVNLTSRQSNATMTNEQLKNKITLMKKNCNNLERKNRILELKLLENQDKQGEIFNDDDDGDLSQFVKIEYI